VAHEYDLPFCSRRVSGSVIGNFTSLASAWFTQHSQDRANHRSQGTVRRQKLFKRFIDEASKLYADAPRVHERAEFGAGRRLRANKPDACSATLGCRQERRGRHSSNCRTYVATDARLIVLPERSEIRCAFTLPAERIGPAKLRCSAASHNGVRVDLSVIDRGVSSDQIGSHQQTAAYRGLPRRSLLSCASE
jgi:hypothetical protein